MAKSDYSNLRVFVSANASTDISMARRLFTIGHISTVNLDDAYMPDSATGLRNVLQTVDALVALVDERKPSAGVLIEIGAAWGQGLPVVLLLAEADLLSSLPSLLRELPAVVTKGEEAAVGLRLAGSIRSAVESVSGVSEPKRGEAAQGYVQQVEMRAWADDSERRVATVLASLGARVVGQEPANDRGQVDLAVWISALPAPSLNPILVEVAGRHPDLRFKERQLHRFLQEHDAQVGMLVLQDDQELHWNIRDGRAVAVLGFKRLSNLTPDRLVRLVMDGRNRLTHSVS